MEISSFAGGFLSKRSLRFIKFYFLLAIGKKTTLTIPFIETVVLIFGIAIWSMATPENYNSMTDMIAMISMEKPRKIEEFYEAYKNVDTPFGSAWLAKFYTMRQKSLKVFDRRQGVLQGLNNRMTVYSSQK